MNLLKSIATIGGYTILSRLTGFARDMATANVLGAGAMADAFFVALRFPNLFRRLFAEGALSAAFVPIFSEQIEVNGKESARKFAEEAVSFLTVTLLLFVALMEIVMPYAIYIMAPGFGNVEGKLELAITLTRITFPFLLFISIFSLQSGVLNSLGKFAAPAGAPIIFNLCGIIALYWLTPFTPTPAHAISIGVTVSGILHVVLLAYFIKKENFKMSLLNFKVVSKISNEVKTLLIKMLPGIFGAGIYQINLVVDTILVSLVSDGAVSWLYYSNHLIQLPLGVVGIAIGTALLPMLSRTIKAGRAEEALGLQNKSLEISMLLTVPASAALAVLSRPIVAVLLEHGAFTKADTDATSAAIVAFAFGLPAYVIAKVFSPGFFARGDTSTPVKASTISLVSNIFLNVALMIPFGHVGIAAATSISAWVGAIILAYKLKQADFLKIDPRTWKRIFMISLATLIMTIYIVLIRFLLAHYLPDWMEGANFIRVGIFSFLILSGFIVFTVSAILCKAVSIREFKSAFRRT